jgi:ABC-2 type transport system permease protein
MKALVRSELLKMRTLRSFWWTAVAVLGAIPLLIASAITHDGDIHGRLQTGEGIRNVFSASSSGLMLIVGIMVMAGEFRHSTAASTFLTTPDRARVIRAKLIAGSLVGLAFAVLAGLVALAVAVPWLEAKHVDVAAHAGDVAIALLGSFTATALYASVGVGLGVLVRNQTIAITGALGWLFVAEGVLLAFAPELGRWLPGGAAAAMSGTTGLNGGLLPMWAGALVFAAYGLAFAAAGTWFITRRDIP